MFFYSLLFLLFVFLVIGIWIWKEYLKYFKAIQTLKHIPGIDQFLSPVEGIFPNFLLTEVKKRQLPFQLEEQFQIHNSPIIRFCTTSLFGFPYFSPDINVYTNDAEIVKQIGITNRKTFIKPAILYVVLEFFGKNVVTAEDGDEWRRHRIPLNGAFGENTNTLVAETAIKYLKLSMKYWNSCIETSEKKLFELNASEWTNQITLAIICQVGFGITLNLYSDDLKSKEITHCFKVVSETIFVKLLLPSFAFKLPIKYLREIDNAFQTFDRVLREIMETAKKGIPTSDKPSNILTTITQSGGLIDSEMLGNSFILLLAGHETTAHTVAFALLLLALNPEEQEKAFNEIQKILPNNREIEVEDVKNLDYSLWIFKECLRLYPPVVDIPKETTEDTTLGGYFIPKGTRCRFYTYSLHRNPKYYPNPSKFYPSRWDTSKYDEIPVNAFAPFSVGPRSCIGNKFALVEGVALLTVLIQNYTFEINPKYDVEQMKAFQSMITTTPLAPIQLILKKRK